MEARSGDEEWDGFRHADYTARGGLRCRGSRWARRESAGGGSALLVVRVRPAIYVDVEEHRPTVEYNKNNALISLEHKEVCKVLVLRVWFETALDLRSLHCT